MTAEESGQFDQVARELRDELSSDRARVRHTFMWLITVLIFSVLAAVVIVLWAGIAMLRQTATVVDNMEWLDSQLVGHSLQLGDISNRVAQISRGQLDVASRMNRLQLTQQQSLDQLGSETDRHRRWIEARELQIERERSGLDQRLQQRGEVLDQMVGAVAGLQEKLDGLLRLDSGVIVAGREPAVQREVPESDGPSAFTERPLWSALLDSFEGVVLADVFQEVAGQVDVTPPEGSRTISVVQFPNGDRYEGTFENGLMHGWGVYTGRSGARYEGQYYQDLKHGNGTLVQRDGTRYEGAFVRGIRQGLGSLTKVDGTRFAGAFANDMINGRGIMLYPDGSQYAGDFMNGRRHGHGIHRFANGDIYRGEFRQEVRTGTGLYVFADGSSYEGTFVDGVRHGRGHYRFADGTAFIGEFRNGLMHGEGVRISDGRRIRGVWHEGNHVRDL
ncbi:MAG: MORN repeat-containing protein [Kiritimatiellia bacterium]